MLSRTKVKVSRPRSSKQHDAWGRGSLTSALSVDAINHAWSVFSTRTIPEAVGNVEKFMHLTMAWRFALLQLEDQLFSRR